MSPYLISHIMDRISRSASCLFLTLTLILILTLPFAHAGEYHAIKEKTKINQEVLACSQCHTMHGTQGSTSMVYQKYGVTTGIYAKLLRQATILQLCLYCHDGNTGGVSPTPPDIWGPTLAATQTNPSGGSLCSGGPDNATPPCGTTSTNHTVDVNATVTVPGSNPAITFDSTTGAGGFTCVNCHNPHGTTSYRNLRDNGTQYAGVTFMATGETITYSMSPTENDANYVNNLVAAGFGLAKYETSNVLFKKVPTANTAGIQGFCRSCHTLFHGAGGEANMGGTSSALGDNNTGTPWLRHPTRDTSIGTGATNLHADSTCWTTGTTPNCAEAFTTRVRHIEPDATSSIGGNEVPFCLTCHRAHGSSRHSNLIYGPPNSVGGSNESATAMMRSTCQQCHNQ